MSSGGISLQGITKVYDGGVLAVDHVDLEIEEGEFMVFVGPSGCGKTTLLRLIAGLEEASDGAIVIGGRDVTMTRPQERDIAMVFQNYALYPHMTVRENIGLRARAAQGRQGGARRRVARRSADAWPRRSCSSASRRRSPGGQRQRVAIGRALLSRAGRISDRRAALEPRCETARRRCARRCCGSTSASG